MKVCKGFPELAGCISCLSVCLWEYLLFSNLYNSEQVDEWGSLGRRRTGGMLQSVELHYGDTH